MFPAHRVTGGQILLAELSDPDLEELDPADRYAGRESESQDVARLLRTLARIRRVAWRSTAASPIRRGSRRPSSSGLGRRSGGRSVGLDARSSLHPRTAPKTRRRTPLRHRVRIHPLSWSRHGEPIRNRYRPIGALKVQHCCVCPCSLLRWRGINGFARCRRVKG